MNTLVKQVVLIRDVNWQGTKSFEDSFDLTKPTYAIVVIGDCNSDIEGIEKCEDWLQLRQRYFANQAAKELRRYILEFLRYHRNYRVTINPASMGIDINETLTKAGIKTESPSKKIYQVALVWAKRNEPPKRVGKPKLQKTDI